GAEKDRGERDEQAADRVDTGSDRTRIVRRRAHACGGSGRAGWYAVTTSQNPASDRSRSSEPGAPMSVTPNGAPPDHPAGSDTAGSPARFTMLVNHPGPTRCRSTAPAGPRSTSRASAGGAGYPVVGT